MKEALLPTSSRPSERSRFDPHGGEPPCYRLVLGLGDPRLA